MSPFLLHKSIRNVVNNDSCCPQSYEDRDFFAVCGGDNRIGDCGFNHMLSSSSFTMDEVALISTGTFWRKQDHRFRYCFRIIIFISSVGVIIGSDNSLDNERTVVTVVVIWLSPSNDLNLSNVLLLLVVVLLVVISTLPSGILVGVVCDYSWRFCMIHTVTILVKAF